MSWDWRCWTWRSRTWSRSRRRWLWRLTICCFASRGRKVAHAFWQHDGSASGVKPVGYGNCFVTLGLIVHLPMVSMSRLWGHAFLVRHADDFVICFSREDDARRVIMAVLPKRIRVVKLKTSRTAFAKALRTTGLWCRHNRHLPISEQAAVLGRKLRGYYAYFGIVGNSIAISRFHHWVVRAWHRWLSRRS